MPTAKKSSTSNFKRVTSMTVGNFFAAHAKALHLHLQGSEVGFKRKIMEPSVNRPGLALSGFFDYFAYKRIQVMGNSEFAYLDKLDRQEEEKHFQAMCEWAIPCIIVARGRHLPDHLMAIAERAGISVFNTTINTMKFINSATLWVEWDFAPTTSEHGCMVDVQGIGVLIRGKSGTGKSEAALGLLERGHSLVADDVVMLRAPEGRELTGTAKDVGRFHIEVRGLGLVNVLQLFGIGSMRMEKRLDMVVTLELMENMKHIERVGSGMSYYKTLGRKLPHVTLPVAPGRDMARLVEVAALEMKLRSYGINSAEDFSRKLLKIMREKRIS